jgi:hypothetical protein
MHRNIPAPRYGSILPEESLKMMPNQFPSTNGSGRDKHTKKRRVITRIAAFIILIAATAAVALLMFWPATEPSYEGKPLSHWLEQYRLARHHGVLGQAQSEEAVRAIGTNAFPVLIRMIQTHDSRLKQLLMNWSSKQTLFQLGFTPASELRYRAMIGYEILGPAAKSQVAELTAILTMAKVAEVRASTASALGNIGEEAKSAVPALLITAKDQDQRVRNNSLWALRQVRADPELVLPTMIAALEDPYSTARENAAIALAQYGPVASNAIPVLLRTMQSNDVALHALQKIAPEAAPRVQSK